MTDREEIPAAPAAVEGAGHEDSYVDLKEMEDRLRLLEREIRYLRH